jgi:hypothetical protein
MPVRAVSAAPLRIRSACAMPSTSKQGLAPFLDVCSFCFLLSHQIKCESGSLSRAARRALSADCVGVVALCPGSAALSRA